ncbi:MAG: hypothetical protein U1F71_20310 [Verrucomicrobiaceae bacterium]
MAIVSAVQNHNAARDWWCESFCFYEDPQLKNHLVGNTKLFLNGYTAPSGQYVQVDPDEDCFMAAEDAQFIIDQLAEFSRQHGIQWVVDLEGAELGTIAGGIVPAELTSMLMELKAIAPPDCDSKALLIRHASRNQ